MASLDSKDRSYLFLKLRILFVIALTLPIISTMFGLPLSPKWQLLLTTGIQIGGGYPFYKGAYKSIRSRSANMDVLVVMGTATPFLLSSFFVIFSIQGDLYFETSAILIALILMGRLIEGRAKQSAQKGISALSKMAAKSAHIRKGSEIVEIEIQEVVVGDTVVIKPNQRIPVDGQVLHGVSHVNEAMLTGESGLKKKQVGDRVFAGTINGNGMIEIESTCLGKQTSLDQIIRLVEEARKSKAPIQKLVDRVSAVFVPVCMGIALITFLIWGALFDNWSGGGLNGISVLLVACPCALGLATPIVIMVACGIGSQRGILIKDIVGLERAHKIDRMIFDKTGTITENSLSVVKIQSDDPELLKKAASLTVYSNHPISKAVTQYAKKQDLNIEKCENFYSHTGQGLSGTSQKKSYLVGSAPFFEHQKVDRGIFSKVSVPVGCSPLFLAEEKRCIGVIFLADQMRKESQEVVKKLRHMGKKVALLSGDRVESVKFVADQLGIDEFFAEMLPKEKSNYVEKLKAKRHVVGMVGDGVNDAVALAASDVGFSFAQGADVAMESASIGLMHNNLSNILTVLSLSRLTFLKIRQNLFFAFAYNCLGIPLAAFGFLNPVIAAIAMALSSFSVILNALTIRRHRLA